MRDAMHLQFGAHSHKHETSHPQNQIAAYIFPDEAAQSYAIYKSGKYKSQQHNIQRKIMGWWWREPPF